MFKKSADLANSIQPGAQQRAAADASAAVNRLFMLFHGYYGSLFLSKFATGDLDEQGKDRGIKNARIVWSAELREYPLEVIEDAAVRAKAQYTEFPPSLPQFLALVKAAAPRQVHRIDHPSVKAIPMGAELRSSMSRRIREQALAKARKAVDERTGYMQADEGLVGLKQLIAKAVAYAGGDEAAELARLDRLMAGAA